MIMQGGIILTDNEEVLLEANAEIKTFTVAPGSHFAINQKGTMGNGTLYLTNHRLLFLAYSASLSSMFGKNKRPMLLFSESLIHILRMSATDDKTLSVDTIGSFLNFNFKDKIAKQWNEKILEIINQ